MELLYLYYTGPTVGVPSYENLHIGSNIQGAKAAILKRITVYAEARDAFPKALKPFKPKALNVFVSDSAKQRVLIHRHASMQQEESKFLLSRTRGPITLGL